MCVQAEILSLKQAAQRTSVAMAALGEDRDNARHVSGTPKNRVHEHLVREACKQRASLNSLLLIPYFNTG